MTEKLQKLQELIRLTNDGLTKEEFTKNFLVIVDLVKKLQASTKETLDSLQAKYDEIVQSVKTDLKQTPLYTEIVDNIKSEALSEVKDVRQKAMDFLMEGMGKIGTEHASMRSGLETRLEQIKQDVTPDIGQIANQAADTAHKKVLPQAITAVKNALIGLGSTIVTALERLPNEEKLEIEAVKDLRKELDELKKSVSNRIIGGGGVGKHNIAVYDLSSSLDGSTKTFNLPAVWKVHTAFSTSIPMIFRPTTDFTWTSSSVTFTSEIQASTTLASGQTVLILYSE